jgi:hypothetical protein
MSNTSITYLVAGCAAVFSLAAWVAWVLVPAVGSYSRLWERLVAGLLSLYVLAAFLLAGTGIGAALLWYYDEI